MGGSSDDLRSALQAHPKARSAWEALPPSHRREYVEWIEEAKRPETRNRRIARTVAMIVHQRSAD